MLITNRPLACNQTRLQARGAARQIDHAKTKTQLGGIPSRADRHVDYLQNGYT